MNINNNEVSFLITLMGNIILHLCTSLILAVHEHICIIHWSNYVHQSRSAFNQRVAPP